MRTRILTIVLTCCALAAVPASGQSRGTDRKTSGAPATRDTRNDSRQPFQWWKVDKIKQELKLTAEQSASIERIFQASMDQLRVDKAALDLAQADFSKLMEQPTASERDFTRAVDKLEMARYYTSKERTTMLVRIHSILTPDQRKGLEVIRKRNDADKNRPH